MQKLCTICDYEFKNGDNLVAVVLSTYVTLDSGVTFAITEPTKCLEIIHVECYDGPLPDEEPLIGGIN